MQIPGALPITETAHNLEKKLFPEKEADLILHGHARCFDDISLISHLLKEAQDLIAGKTEKDPPYHWHGGTGRYHPFMVDESKTWSMQDHGICYDPDNIR